MQFTVYRLGRNQFQSNSELCGSSISLIKQQFIVTQRYIVFHKTEKTWQIYTYVIFLQKYTEKQYIFGNEILVEGMFLTQLSNNM